MLLETIIFGEWDAARAAVDEVNAVHRRVAGVLPVAAGRFAQGTPYSANDPELLLWTLAVLADSAIYFYELFVRNLETQELDSLWRDYRRFGGLFGLDLESGPQTYASFQTWWHEALCRFELTPEAQKTGHAIAFQIPLPAYLAPVQRLHNTILKGSLPVKVREGYGISFASREHTEFEQVCRKVIYLRKRLPQLLTRGRNSYYFRYVARTEARRVAGGRPTPELAVPHQDR